jgi:hypothetical protein
MSLLKPYLRLTRDRLTALINNDSDQDRVEGVDFVYGDPQQTLGPNGTNTVVTLIPLPGSNYYEPTQVYYNRLHISVAAQSFYNAIEPVTIPSVPFRMHDILSEINRVFGLNLTTDDVNNTEHVSEESSYTLFTNGNKSLIWMPSTLQFSATVVTTSTECLDDLIPVDYLDGFNSQPISLCELINTTALDGFGLTNVVPHGDLGNIINNPLDGFDSNCIVLSQAICDTFLDGFHVGPTALNEAIEFDYLDGFNIAKACLEDAFENNNLYGFNISPSELNLALSSNILDGFTFTIASFSDILRQNTFDGFDSIETGLEEVITSVNFDGFSPNSL